MPFGLPCLMTLAGRLRFHRWRGRRGQAHEGESNPLALLPSVAPR